MMNSVIPIIPEKSNPPATSADEIIYAVITEIDHALEKLVNDHQESVIDLRAILLSEQTEKLRHLLGKGEVSIKLELGDATNIEETAINGVWWLTHFDEKKNKSLEMLEITYMPSIVKCNVEDVEFGQQKLKNIRNQQFSVSV